MAVVEQEDRGAVRWLYLNRPERRNALSGAVIEGLMEGLAAASADESVRCVVLAGRGGHFCAGGDLGGDLGAGGGVVATEQQRARYPALLAAIYGAAVPVIAAVEGDALGGGLGLVAACDLAVADAGARLGTPEIRVGLFPLIISAVLQRGVARKALLELMYTGDRIGAEQARQLGLLNRVAEAGRLQEATDELAQRIASHSRAVLGLGKRAFHTSMDMELRQALEYLNGRLTVNLLTEDAAEGIGAFLGRRAPEWKHR